MTHRYTIDARRPADMRHSPELPFGKKIRFAVMTPMRPLVRFA
jgi:hypothetical protein